jgi:putative oxidoreductase
VDEGLLILRLVVGLTMAAHGSQKLFGWFGGGGIAGTGAFFGSLGYRAPATFALLAGLTEFLGGLALAVGFLVPLAAMGIAVVMLNAIESVKYQGGFFAGNGGYEFEFLLLGSSIALATTGPGRFSLDRAIGWDNELSGYAIGGAALAGAIIIGFVTMTWGRGQPESTELST